MKSTTKSNELKELRSLWILTIITFILLILFSSGCTDSCEVTRSYISYEPVYTTTDEIRESIEFIGPEEISNPGRIYFKDGFIYINESAKGIHVIDNRIPTQPNKLGFLNIPGNYDLAAKGNHLYADSYVDLVVFDISNPASIEEVGRMNGVFASYDTYIGLWNEEEETIITDWEQNLVQETFESECGDGDVVIMEDALFDQAGPVASLRAESSVDPNSNTTGVGGSLAKFTIYNDFLYTVNSYEMRLFDISNATEPETGETIPLGWGIETIFPYGDKLFIGAMNGMHIYDNVNPESPEWISTYEHINSCDPVVVQDDLAYVTLRSGTECEGFTNQLDIVDISDLSRPELFKTYEMQNPHGLGIDGTCLFITEGEFGLKFFNATDPDNLEEIAHQEGLHAIDVIPLNEILMVIGNDGFHQYEYNCETGAFDRLSTIQITQL